MKGLGILIALMGALAADAASNQQGCGEQMCGKVLVTLNGPDYVAISAAVPELKKFGVDVSRYRITLRQERQAGAS